MEETRRHRSPKAPSKRLGDCIENIRTLYKAFGRSSVTKAEIGSALEMSSGSGTFLRLMATLRGFGLLEKMGGQYRVSELGIQLKNTSPEGPEWQELALSAIRNSEVLAELLRRYGGKVPPEQTVARYLEEQQGFSEDKARETASVFGMSLIDAGIVDRQGNIVVAKQMMHSDEEASQGAPEAAAGAPQAARQDAPAAVSVSQPAGTTDIPLSNGRFARVQYPNDLTSAEAERIGRILALLVVGTTVEPEGSDA